MRSIYLCGPCSHLTFDEASGWRDQVQEALGRIFRVVNPLRGEAALKDAPQIPALGDDRFPETSGHAIFRRDVQHVKDCDILLANFLGADRISIGSISEIAIAWQLGKYIVVVMEPDNGHDHLFIREMAAITLPTLEQTYQYLTRIF